MSESSNKHLAKVIADVAVFLEFTDADLLDPDTAVDAMEQMASELQLMGLEDKMTLTLLFEEISDQFKNPLHKEFVKNLSDSLGIQA